MTGLIRENNDIHNDSLLVAAALNGKGGALEELVRRHQGWIYNIAFKMIMDHEDARDITQEVLIKFITHLASFQPEKAAFRTWLYRIVVNHTFEYEEKKKFETRIHDCAYVSILDKIAGRSHGIPARGLKCWQRAENHGCMMGIIVVPETLRSHGFSVGRGFRPQRR
ncbi:MAG: sigma-70 family RNA polymerase sigma factor [Desulfobacterales bacterium]